LTREALAATKKAVNETSVRGETLNFADNFVVYLVDVSTNAALMLDPRVDLPDAIGHATLASALHGSKILWLGGPDVHLNMATENAKSFCFCKMWAWWTCFDAFSDQTGIEVLVWQRQLVDDISKILASSNRLDIGVNEIPREVFWRLRAVLQE
jgi:hypothetical protein